MIHTLSTNRFSKYNQLNHKDIVYSGHRKREYILLKPNKKELEDFINYCDENNFIENIYIVCQEANSNSFDKNNIYTLDKNTMEYKTGHCQQIIDLTDGNIVTIKDIGDLYLDKEVALNEQIEEDQECYGHFELLIMYPIKRLPSAILDKYFNNTTLLYIIKKTYHNDTVNNLFIDQKLEGLCVYNKNGTVDYLITKVNSKANVVNIKSLASGSEYTASFTDFNNKFKINTPLSYSYILKEDSGEEDMNIKTKKPHKFNLGDVVTIHLDDIVYEYDDNRAYHSLHDRSRYIDLKYNLGNKATGKIIHIDPYQDIRIESEGYKFYAREEHLSILVPKSEQVENSNQNQKTNEKTNQKEKGQIMAKSTLKENTVALVAQNKDATIYAAKITAGKALNKKALEMIKPKLPMMARGYTDHAVAAPVMANIVALGIKQFLPDNIKANQVADLMIESSAFQMMEGFNAEEMLNNLLDGISLPNFSEPEGE